MSRLRSITLLLLLGLAAGCGPGMGQVDGKLVWADGKPAGELEGSEVVFEAAAGGLSARGTVGKDGGFKLRTAGTDDGAPVGEYKVMVAEHQKMITEGQLAPRQLDPKYHSLKTSGLTASVKSGVTPLSLTVTKAAGKK